jgi:uncharacterized protein YdhG (YjbR/CyaY superfamily)
LANDAVSEYISGFAPEVIERLEVLRSIVAECAPGAVECIAYGMPGYKLNGKPLVYFGAFAKHVGVYALPAAHEHFTEELKVYKHGKGSVQFANNKPLPLDLIRKMIKFNAGELMGE